MPPFDYTGSADTARTLIDQFGRTVRLVRPTGTSIESDKPWRGEDPPVNDPANDVRAAIFDVALRLIDGVNIIRGDKTMLVGPDVDMIGVDGVIDENEVWRVIQPSPLKPGEVRVMTSILLRK